MPKSTSAKKSSSNDNQERFDYILGLDVGTNSLGWAVVRCNVNKKSEKKEIVNRDTGEVKTSFSQQECLPVSLHSLNVRIFQERVDAKTREPKNQHRRAMRSARKRLDRLQYRRRALQKLLIDNKLLPKEYLEKPERCLNEIDLSFAERVLKKEWGEKWSEEDKLWISPYAIRSYGVENELKPYEFGRLLLHLQRRRGYFSNREIKYKQLNEYIQDKHTSKDNHRVGLSATNEDTNADVLDDERDKEKAKETKLVLGGIAALEEAMAGKTLGQYIWSCTLAKDTKIGQPQRITRYSAIAPKRERKTKPDGSLPVAYKPVYFFAQRSMYEDEFEKIWKKQEKCFDKNIVSLKKKIHHYLFHQHPLKSTKNLVGFCSLMPKSRRAKITTPEFQEYRTRHVINNIQIKTTEKDIALCQPELEKEREALYEALQNPVNLTQKGRIGWKMVAQILTQEMNIKIAAKDLNYSSKTADDINKDGIVGNRIHLALYQALGGQGWASLTKKYPLPSTQESKQKNNTSIKTMTDLIRLIITTQNKLNLYNCLVNKDKWSFSKGFGGDAYKIATCQLEDGYGKHSHKAINKLLPHMRKGMMLSQAIDQCGLVRVDTTRAREECRLLSMQDLHEDNIANPIVDKALWEIRRVFNAIVKRHGPPKEIRIELARNMKESKQRRKEIEETQRNNRRLNEEADKAVIEHMCTKEFPDLQPTKYNSVRKNDRDKYKMWQYEQDGTCLFCGVNIDKSYLFDGNTEIEHIWPQSGFKQNYMNTVVSCRACNQYKGNRTPFEAWGDTDRWQQIEERVRRLSNAKKLPRNKMTRILRKDWQAEKESDFVQRQLQDTSYIASQAKRMLEKTNCFVGVSKGAAVSELRHLWGVNNVLPEHPEKIYTESDKKTEAGKALKYFDATRAEQSKNRKDHRHHAIDAFMIAMTDSKVLHDLTTKYQQKRHEQGKPIIRDREVFSLPESWQDKQNLDILLREKLLPNIVSHSAQRKITGALHEETAYGKSFYTTQYEIDLRNKGIEKIRQYLVTNHDAEGDVQWIQDKRMRALLKKWLEESGSVKPSERTLPVDNSGVTIKNIAIANRCYTIRKPIGETLKYIDKEPGTGTWIVDTQSRHSLRKWYKEHGKNIKQVLETHPPQLINNAGKGGETLKRITLAKKHGAASITLLQKHKIFALGNNHHLVLFWNGKEGKDSKRRANFVSVLEARRRVSRGEEIIQRAPPTDWDGTWHYQMDLCINDMVLWTGDLDENMSPGLNTSEKGLQNPETLSEKDLGKRIFRIQKMSASRGIVELRHHTVATTDDEWGQKRCSPNTLFCQKLYFGNLGWTSGQTLPTALRLKP